MGPSPKNCSISANRQQPHLQLCNAGLDARPDSPQLQAKGSLFQLQQRRLCKALHPTARIRWHIALFGGGAGYHAGIRRCAPAALSTLLCLLGVFTLRFEARLRGRRARPRGAERAGLRRDGTPQQFGVECVVHTPRAQHSQHARSAQELRIAARSRDSPLLQAGFDASVLTFSSRTSAPAAAVQR